MSEASSAPRAHAPGASLRPAADERRSVLPVEPPRRADMDPQRVCAARPAPAAEAPVYSLDPPLVDVRIPVKAPHAAATAYSRSALMHRFPGAEVGDDLHMLFTELSEGQSLEPGNGGNAFGTRRRLSPDVLLALGVPRSDTRSEYDADVLGPPDFTLEVLSRSTWQHDVGRKLNCYQQIGVRECLLFDVTGEDLAGTGTPLWGFALRPGRREPLAEVALPNGKRGMHSAVLGLVAYVADRQPPAAPGDTWALTMRWHDPATGADIPDYEELAAAAQAERSRADTAQQEVKAAQGRIAELERLLRLGRAP